MIGADFEKIEVTLFGMDLLEPMGFITDTILGVLSVVLAVFLLRMKIEHPVRTYWIWFFIIFGVGAFVGGLGHLFFNYWGIPGKFPSWLAGPLSIFLLEQGVISAHPNEKRLSQFKMASFIKLVLVYVAFTIVCINAPIHEKPQLAFLPIAINTIVGVILTAGFLANSFAKKITPEYKYLVFGVLVLLPSAFIFLLKINLAQWFDKNDLSHILMMAGIIYFYIGVKKTLPYLKKKD